MEEFLRSASRRELDKIASRPNEMVASKMSTFALRQMQKMGWSEGKGLGKKEDGSVSHVRADKRDENIGLGFKEKDYERWGEQWWYEHYNKTAATIGGDAAMTLSSDSDDSSDEEDEAALSPVTPTPRTPAEPRASAHVPTDEELLRACRGRRCGMRARATQKGKWRRAEALTPRSEAGEAATDPAAAAAAATAIVADAPPASRKRARGDAVDGDGEGKRSDKRRSRGVGAEAGAEADTEEAEGADSEDAGKAKKKKKKDKKEKKDKAKKAKEEGSKKVKKDKKAGEAAT